MTSHLQTWTRVLLLFAACTLVNAVQPLILGDEHGFILGWSTNKSCVFMSDLLVKKTEAIRWLLDGKPMKEHFVMLSTLSNVFVYTSCLTIHVTADLNGKVLACQSLINKDKIEEITETIVVIKLVEKPIITGPSKVIGGLRYKWTCVADGASRGPPTIKWFFGNKTAITKGFSTENNIYPDKDNLLTHNTSSTLFLKPSETDTTFSVYCQAKERGKGPLKVSNAIYTRNIQCLQRQEFSEEGVDVSSYKEIYAKGFFEFETSELEVDEPDHETKTVSVQVLRQCNSSFDDVVMWEVTNATGRKGLEEYSGEVNFLVGDTSAPLKLNIRSDDIPELEETITIKLLRANKGVILRLPEKFTFFLKIRANDDPYGYFVLTGPTSTTDPNKVNATITRKGGAFGVVEVVYQVAPPVHVSRGSHVTDTNSSGFGQLMFAENETVSHLLLSTDGSRTIRVTLLSARLISSPQVTPVPNSPRLGELSERQVTSIANNDETSSTSWPDDEDKNNTDKAPTVEDAVFTDYEARSLSTKDILFVILPTLFVIFIIMIIGMCCYCAFCGIIRKSCRVGDEKKCICCKRVCCFCTPIYGVINEEKVELTKSEN